MKRIILAFILVLAMVAMVVPVSAASGDSLDGNAEVGITGNAPIIIDPEDPSDPTDPDDDTPLVPQSYLDLYGNTNFYFGSQKMSFANVTYDSRNNAGGVGEKVGVMVISTEDETQEWQVTVAIGGFFMGANETMKGFTVNMKAVDNDNKGGTPGMYYEPTIDAAADGGLGDADLLFEGGYGLSACNWTGKLNVLAETAKAGESSAVMAWAIAITP